MVAASNSVKHHKPALEKNSGFECDSITLHLSQEVVCLRENANYDN
ncbi:hypothetical protein COO91_07009 [Nostoc flagelliforme CCNUN1]|uniref:Uncharacterized protein n=1 Tax=Nostoc flagelliforme CCNUN1 TaxID=2038116 RepID=A0A2K8T043_9NOSO|nr:hypothetical protein COO91_07009 [Nostoc flagelliforme CCNUN1]